MTKNSLVDYYKIQDYKNAANALNRIPVPRGIFPSEEAEEIIDEAFSTSEDVNWAYENMGSNALIHIIQTAGFLTKDDCELLLKNPQLDAKITTAVLTNRRTVADALARRFFLAVDASFLEASAIIYRWNKANNPEGLTSNSRRKEILTRVRQIHQIDDEVPDSYVAAMFLV